MREHIKHLFSVEKLNTAEIAQRIGKQEADVYNALYSFEGGARFPKTAAEQRAQEAEISADRSRQIIADIAERHGISVDAIKSRRRDAVVVRARQEAFSRLRHDRLLTYSQIARIMGGWDHSTVIYGIQAHHARQAYLASKSASQREKS